MPFIATLQYRWHRKGGQHREGEFKNLGCLVHKSEV